MLIKDATKEQFEKEIKSDGLVIVDFFATWCGPCQMYGPEFESTSLEIKDVTFIKVDIDKENELAIDSGVMGVPTTIAFKNGKQIDKFSGFAAKAQLIDFVNKNK